ncbi:MAG: rod shape-determining protein [Patescibacteria group bacterium]
MFSRFFGKFSQDLGIDLGTANTRVFVKERGLVIDEPSVVALNNRTGRIIAVGREAKEMIGKTPSHITVSRPLAKGIISDFEVTEKMLRYFIDKIHSDGFTLVPRPRVVIGVPLEITEVERKAVEDAVLSAGAREVSLVEGPMVAAIGARLPVREAVGNIIIDIGGGTTEIAVVALSGVVIWKSFPVAGDEFNKNIIQYARENFNLHLGEKVAEAVKIQIGSAADVDDMPAEVLMRGRDVVTGLPREVAVRSDDIREALARSVRVIVEGIKSTLERTPPDLVADISERGMALVGGSALLRGIDAAIAKATATPVKMVDDPQSALVRGTGILLESNEWLKEIALPSARDGA